MCVKWAGQKVKKVTRQVVVRMTGKTSVVVEVNCETDFVAKDENFGAFADAVAGRVLSDNPADIDALMAMPLKDGDASVLLKNPGLVADSWLNLASAIWFFAQQL